MALLSKFIDSLNVHLYRTAFREVVHPVKLNGSFDKHNVIIHLNKGKLLVGPEDEVMPPDSFYFFLPDNPSMSSMQMGITMIWDRMDLKTTIIVHVFFVPFPDLRM